MNDSHFRKIVAELPEGKRPEFSLQNDVLQYINSLCVPNIPELKNRILEEAHSTKYSVYLGGTKKIGRAHV